MPTPKELLQKTVDATKKLFNKADELRKIEESIRKAEQLEAELRQSNTKGVTTPPE